VQALTVGTLHRDGREELRSMETRAVHDHVDKVLFAVDADKAYRVLPDAWL
jgi:hypothetical protein